MPEQEVKEKLAQQFYLWDNKPTLDKSHYDMAEDILIILKQAGYAQLAEDQGLPPNPYFDMADAMKGIASPQYCHAQKAREDMLAANFKKIRRE